MCIRDRHNERFTTGYRIYDNDRLGELLAQYGGQLVFSGHLHPQHIALWQGEEGQQVWDVASESLAVWPYLSGRVTISPDGAGRASYDYEAKPTDVTAWAAATGQTDPVFEDFSAFGREQFAQNSTSRGADKFVEALGEEDAAAFRRVMGEANVLYFSGALTREAADELTASPDWAAVTRAGEQGVDTARYLSTLVNEAQGDHCHLHIDPAA